MNGQYRLGDVVFKNWTLTRLLGQDAAGSVYEASQNASGQIIKSAIKIITIPQNLNDIKNIMADGMDKNGVIEYFRGSIGDLLEEFLLLTELQGSSNILNYDEHQVVEHKEGIGWDIILRMELLTTLLEYAHVKPLRRENIIQLGIDICYALEHCAEVNIVHRDIKPGNIFISPKGEFLLGDFGVARALDKTAGGIIKNAYTAPEIYRGEQYDETVDIYSLGIVLYRLLNLNRTPFMPDYPTPISHNTRDLALNKQLQGVPMPAPKNADSQLAKVVLRACAFNPESRYATPTQMREDLEAVLTGRDIAPPPVSYGAQASTPTAFTGTQAGTQAAAAPKKPPIFDYEQPDTGFYNLLKDKASGTKQEPSVLDDDPYLDTDTSYREPSYIETGYKESGYKDISYKEPSYQEPYRRETAPLENTASRKFDFEDELYDAGKEKSLFTTIQEFMKDKMLYAGIIGAAILLIILVLVVMNPFSRTPAPVEPDINTEEEEPPPPAVKDVPIPDLRNWEYTEILVDERLTGVFTFDIRREYSDTVPEGFVISQNPQENTSVPTSPLGDRIRINLVVSDGPEPSPFDAITSIEVRFGNNPLPGRNANPSNPSFTLRLSSEPTIVLTCRIEPADFLERFIASTAGSSANNGEGGESAVLTLEDLADFIEWISTDEDVFTITSTNPTDNTARIQAMNTGSAILIVRVGEHEDRVIVTVNN